MISYKKHIKTTSSMAERDLIRYLRKIANKAAKHIGVSIKVFDKFPVDHEFIRVAAGACHQSSGLIYINMYDCINGAFYPLESLIDTTLHEVVHLKYKKEQHTKRFWKCLSELEEWYFNESNR